LWRRCRCRADALEHREVTVDALPLPPQERPVVCRHSPLPEPAEPVASTIGSPTMPVRLERLRVSSIQLAGCRNRASTGLFAGLLSWRMATGIYLDLASGTRRRPMSETMDRRLEREPVATLSRAGHVRINHLPSLRNVSNRDWSKRGSACPHEGRPTSRKSRFLHLCFAFAQCAVFGSAFAWWP